MFNNYIINAWRQVAWFNDFESLIVQTTGKTLTTGVFFIGIIDFDTSLSTWII